MYFKLTFVLHNLTAILKFDIIILSIFLLIKLGILAERKVGYMKTKRKRKIVFLCMTCLMILVTIISSGCSAFDTEEIPIPEVQKDVYVYDEDNIIDDETEQKLNRLLIQLESKTTAEVAVITTPSLQNMQIETYSYKLANTLGIGKEDKDNGVLLLISRNDTKVRLEIGKGLEGCLNDSKCGRILDDYFVPYRENDEYSEGTYQTIQAVVSVIAKEYNTTLEGIEKDYNQEMYDNEKEQLTDLIWAIVILIIIIVIIITLDQIFFDGTLSEAIFDSIDSSSGGGGFGGGSFGGGGATR